MVEAVDPTPTLLFASAVTFNGHRIHYDHPYVTGTEGYPGLVVHGPLIATLSLRAFCRANPAPPCAVCLSRRAPVDCAAAV
jgi:itaconyl-CoA hydratase/mesaconyl-C4 CoA hydratase